MDPDHIRIQRLLLEAEGPVTFGPGNQHPTLAGTVGGIPIESFMSMALHPGGGKPWQFGVHQCSYARIWTHDEIKLFEEVGRRLTDRLTAMLAHRKVQESEASLRALIQTIPDLVWAKNLNGALQLCNPAFERLFGVAEPELIGRTYYDFVDRPTADRFEAHDRLALSTGKPCINEEWLVFAADGYRGLFETVKTPLLGPGGTPIGVLGVSRDITRRKQMEDSLRDLAAYNEATREDERRRIAQELHDELGQQLSGLRMNVNLLGFQFGQGDPGMREAITGLLEMVDQTIKVARDVSTSLRPAVLDLGIVPAIEWLAMEFTRKTGIGCDLELPKSDIATTEALAVALFRITQESLTNVGRHARAGRIQVALARGAETCTLEIRDDGIGFDPAAPGRRNAFGIIGMRERALAIGAELAITSAPGQGTQVRVLVPAARCRETCP
jgi:PAS domain S-box-containing protein